MVFAIEFITELLSYGNSIKPFQIMKSKLKLVLISLILTSCSFLDNGERIKYHKNGKVMFVGNIKSGKRIGVWAFYDDKGFSVDSIPYEDGVKNGIAKTYSLFRGTRLSGKGNYVNGKKHGVWESYHDDGNVHSKEEFNMGIPIGIFAYYYADGTPKILTPVQNGKWHGDHKEYYPSGDLSVTGHYHNGMRDGEWKEYYENGLIKEIYHCQTDLWHGNYEKYYPNGNISEKGRYELDNKTGTWEYFDTNGIVISTGKYK
ncbi:hypothetical protein GCM10022259_24310 [Aquimarina mytili]